MKKFLVWIIAVLFFCAPVQAIAKEASWPDLNDTHPYAEELKSLFEHGVLKGYPDGTIKPDQQMNRVEGLKLILQALDTPLVKEVHYEDLKFTDITEEDDDAWYLPYISFAVKYGYMTGFEDGTFRKNDTMTRAEFVKVLFKAKALSPADDHKKVFHDVPRSHWVTSMINYLYDQKLLSDEFDDDNFKPDEPITRSLAAYFTDKLFYEGENVGAQSDVPDQDEVLISNPEEENVGTDGDLSDVDADLQKYLTDRDLDEGVASYYGDSFNGRGTASGEKFDNSKLTAAQPYLPFGSFIRVTNVDNGKSVEVMVNDCGPFVKGRVVDLSKSAFETIGSARAGILRVKVEVVSILEENAFRDRCYELTKK